MQADVLAFAVLVPGMGDEFLDLRRIP